MSKNTAMLVVAALIALVLVSFAWILRDKIIMQVTLPFGTHVNLKGNREAPQAPGSIQGKDLQAGQNIRASSETGGNVTVERGKAEGNIELSTHAPGAPQDPKH